MGRMKSIAVLFAVLLVGCDAWFFRRIDIKADNRNSVAEAIIAYAKKEDIPCSDGTSLPIECWKQPIRIWGVATEQGAVVCYSAMGIPPEKGKFMRRMDALEKQVRQTAGAVLAPSDQQCPEPPFWRG